MILLWYIHKDRPYHTVLRLDSLSAALAVLEARHNGPVSVVKHAFAAPK